MNLKKKLAETVRGSYWRPQLLPLFCIAQIDLASGFWCVGFLQQPALQRGPDAALVPKRGGFPSPSLPARQTPPVTTVQTGAARDGE